MSKYKTWSDTCIFVNTLLSEAVYTTIILKILYKPLAVKKNTHFKIPWMWTWVCEHLILTNFFVSWSRVGTQTPSMLPLLCWLLQCSQGEDHASGVPWSALGHIYSFPRNIGVDLGTSATFCAGSAGSALAWVNWNYKDCVRFEVCRCSHCSENPLKVSSKRSMTLACHL